LNYEFDLTAKTILITGASSGIGRQIAISVSEMGANVVLTARNEERLNKTLTRLSGKNHLIIVTDLKQETDLKKLVQELPKLNGIVHSAGIVKLLPLKFLNDQELRNMLDINYVAPMLLTREILNNKTLEYNSSIVFITSISGPIVGLKANANYSGTKGALTGASKVLALDLAPRKIRVNCIAPGMINTEIVKELEETFSPEKIAEDVKKYPLGSYGEPEDIANACLFLLSDASKWITGTTLVVDGGYTCQ